MGIPRSARNDGEEGLSFFCFNAIPKHLFRASFRGAFCRGLVLSDAEGIPMASHGLIVVLGIEQRSGRP